MDWSLRYDEAVPPLPQPIPGTRSKPLEAGAHRIEVTPRFTTDLVLDGTLSYHGVMRVEYVEDHLRASGDLYRARELPSSERTASSRRGLSVFPVDEYRYYFRLAGFRGRPLELDLDVTRFDAKRGGWDPPVRLTAAFASDADGDQDRLVGTLRNAAGSEVADVTIGWIAEHFREAKVVIAAIEKLRLPDLRGDSAASIFEKAYRPCKWKVLVEERRIVGRDPDAKVPTSELHNLLAEVAGEDGGGDAWTSYLLCVGRIGRGSGRTLGLMFDLGGPGDAARQGAVVAARAPLPDHWPKAVRGKALEDSGAPYLWTAIHEIGHAHNLSHDSRSGLMELIQTAAENPDFPNNLEFEFGPADQDILKHAPDIWVRSGGIPHAKGFRETPVAQEDLRVVPEGLTLEVKCYDNVLPLGAPLRLQVVLRADAGWDAPPSLSFKEGDLSGYVIGPSGRQQSFESVYLEEPSTPEGRLEPGRSIVQDLTLIRGTDGPLLQTPGLHTVVIEVAWHRRIQHGTLYAAFFYLSEQTQALVLPGSIEEAQVARRLLIDPEVMSVLVYRSAVYSKGRATIEEALRAKVLSRYYELIAARFDATKAKLSAEFVRAAGIVKRHARITLNEARNLFDDIYGVGKAPDEARTTPALRRLLVILRHRAKQFDQDPELVGEIESELDKWKPRRKKRKASRR